MNATEERVTHDTALGWAVDMHMFRRGVTRLELGKLLGLTGPSVGRKIAGKVSWTAEEINLTAQYLDVDIQSLMPIRCADGNWMPAPFMFTGNQQAIPRNTMDVRNSAVAGMLKEKLPRLDSNQQPSD